VEGPLADAGLIEGSRQGDPRIPMCTEWIVSKAVGSTLRRGLITHEGCEHQIHSNQVVDQIANVPVIDLVRFHRRRPARPAVAMRSVRQLHVSSRLHRIKRRPHQCSDRSANHGP
jgi:hypothetical protein